MESKITLRTMDDDKDEEWQPLNAMVAENLKNIIIRKIYKDVEKNVGTQKKDASPVVHQYLAALGPILGALSSGMSAGYSAILLPQLTSEDTEIVITKDEGSWIASMLALPLIFGCLVSGNLMDYFGRKTSQLIFCVPFAAGWIVLAFSPNVPALYIGRFITGFSVGVISSVCQVFIAETSEPKHRGMLLSGPPLAVSIGIFLSHILGTFFTWRITAGVCALPPVLFFLLLMFAPESPSWLLQKGKVEAAEKSFQWYRGDSEEATKEFNLLINKNKDPDDKDETPETSKMKLFFKSSFLKPFVVLNFFFLVQQFSGVNAVAFYSINILRNVMSSMNEYVATIVIDVVRFAMSVAAVFLLKRFGRKTLSVVSAVGTATSLFLLAIYLGVMGVHTTGGGNLNAANNITLQPTTTMFTPTINSTNETSYASTTIFTPINDTSFTSNTTITPLNSTAFLKEETGSGFPNLVSYLPMVFLLSYISFVSIGLVPLPWVLSGEIFSKEMRGMGAAGASSFGFLCFFMVVKLTPDFFNVLDTYGTFCLFGTVSVVGSIVLWLFLPETKDKTLMEIEAFYKSKKKSAVPSEFNGGTSIQN